MSVVTSTARRSALNVVPPQTQNTAPVHEFRCLFSRDLVKKKKRWHDGYVKFHTFNQHVMVYDDARNYIGDLHYRQDEDFIEGLELELDRGVLVEVGERIGQTQTDLDQVVNHKPDQQSPQAKANASRVTLFASQSNRSIAEVLGPSQGRIGRSRIPLQSPFEKRRANPDVQVVESVSKRRKIETGKENVPPARVKPISTPARTFPKTGTTKSQPLQNSTSLLDLEEVMDLSSDEDVRTKARSKKTQQKPSRRKCDVRNSKSRPDVTHSSKRPQVRKLTDNGTSQEKIRIPALSPARSAASEHPHADPSTMTTLLRIKATKRRRKLIFRTDLITQQGLRTQSAGFRSGGITSEGCGPAGQASPINNSRPVENRPSRISDRRGSMDDPIGLSSSPLFEPANEEQSQQEEPVSTQNSLEIQLLQHAEQARQSDRDSSPQADPVSPNPTTNSRDTTRQRQEQSSPIPSRNLMPPPPLKVEPSSNIRTSTSPQTRPFRRVLSENDADLLLDAGDATQAIMDELIAPTPLRPQLPRPRQSARSPAKLRRTVSDTTPVANPISEIRSVDTIEPAADGGETGPWTSMEAYILFEWWPPGKQKPDYGEPDYGEPDYGEPPSGIQERPAAALPGITTARDMIRDEINVL